MINYHDFIASEFLNRMTCLNKFIQTSKIKERNDYQSIINLTDSELRIVENHVEDSIKALAKDEPSIRSQKAAFRSLCRGSILIRWICDDLYPLRIIDCPPEIDFFIREAVEQIDKDEQITIPIVKLLTEFNAEQRETNANYFRKIDNDKVLGDSNIEPSIISISKIFYSAPLMWGILLHELGHTFYSRNRFETEILDSISEFNLDLDTLGICQAWTSEIYSDLFATNILGPAYYYTWVHFTSMDYNLNNPSKDHPSHIKRYDYIEKILKKLRLWNENCEQMKRMVEFRNDNIGNVDIILLLQNVLSDPELEQIIQERDDREFKDIEDEIPLDIIYNNIENNIMEHVKSIPISQNKIQHLSNELLNDIPIPSYRTPSTEKYSEPTEYDEIKDFLQNIVDHPNSIVEILNAGWYYRINQQYDSIKDIYNNNKDKMAESFFKDFYTQINHTNNIIKFSIDISTVHKQYRS